ncbi:hypothetical protein [Teredinibacter purpureus]|uniref:hypothetical protein n=1 Tax=Teredinibacter purpureus TaxID=2731756 RepID=UPI0005F7A390|nr:hypothetical protein [Teredinibacter purpureus]
MTKLFSSYWAIPLLTAVLVVFAFISVYLQLFPVPYYLGLALPYMLLVNVITLFYQAVFHREIILKSIFISIASLGLGFLWFIQTA